MKKTLLSALVLGALSLTAVTARAHDDDEDRVTRVDQYPDADVVHYDHHHRYLYTDEFGNVIGERTVHHDHHYVEPRYREYYDYSGYRHHRRYHRVSFWFGGGY